MPNQSVIVTSAATSSSAGRRSARLQKTDNANDVHNDDNDDKKRRHSNAENENENDDDDDIQSHNNNNDSEEESDDESEHDDEHERRRYEFEGKFYDSYQEMVSAKRKRNEDFLKEHGLWKPLLQQQRQQQPKEAQQNGLKKRKVNNNNFQPKQPARKSNRLAGTPADGRFVEHEGGPRSFIIADVGVGTRRTTRTATTTMVARKNKNNQREHHQAANDGSPLSVEDAVLLCDPKWVSEQSVEAAKDFTKSLGTSISTSNDNDHSPINKKSTSPTSVVATDGIATPPFLDSSCTTTIQTQIKNLSVDNFDDVSKVTPERIYSVATHPSQNKLVVCAGDKLGYVGFWNVDHNNSSNANSSGSNTKNDTDGVHLFRFHTQPVNSLEWTSPQGLLSSSYDGTVRYFDLHKETFEQVFATEEEDFYTQYLALDHRSTTSSSHGGAFFLSTSMGTVMHIDRRIGGGSSARNMTFHAQLSDKKINSVSLHRDGYCLATAGLDRTVKFWDLRKFGGNTSSSSSKASSSLATPTEPMGAFLGEHYNKLSVNSAFFSPSGDYLVTTNMANTLNIYHQAHRVVTSAAAGKSNKKKDTIVVHPADVIRHNNNTGRWLTTLMAKWHPTRDIFCVGSMEKPRAIDIFGASGDYIRAVQGDALTAVASRCCFHPSSDQLILVGGNSSGRVTVIR